MLHVGLTVEQQGHDLVSALEAGEGEGGVAVGLDLGVDVGAHVEQQLHEAAVSTGRGKGERGVSGARVQDSVNVNITDNELVAHLI